MRPERFDLPLRIVVEAPVPGVAMALQRGQAGKAQVLAAAISAGEDLAFDLEVVVDGALPDGRPRLLGPYVQGPPDARFFYLCVGQMAGQAGSQWTRRVKVPLGGLSWAQIEAAPAGARLTARIAGKGRDGTPACATLPILPPGWSA